MQVHELKVGQKFRINKKKYELLKNGAGSAYVKELSAEKDPVFEDEEETTFSNRKYTIAPTSEVDEVLK